MVLSKPTKTNLLDHFYEHMAEPDWLTGVDLYQAGKVSDLQTFDSLIFCKLSSFSLEKFEVRLKIHPAMRSIQWIECTCKKNRTHGQYCEHIGALVLHLDRERPDILEKIDTSIPLKPPPPTRKVKANEVLEPTPAFIEDDGVEGAQQTLLKHLSGSIHGVSLLAKGPGLRIKVEIKPGKLTFYDLDLDGAAKFLKTNPLPDNASEELKALTVFDEEAVLGTYIYQTGAETIITERVVVLKAQKKFGSPDPKLKAKVAKSIFIDTANQEDTPQVYEHIPAKTASRFIGKKYFFLPGRGYWPVNHSDLQSQWHELPWSQTFNDDAAAEFINSGFLPYKNFGPIWLDETIDRSHVVLTPKLSSVEVLSEENGWFKLDPKYGTSDDSVSMIDLMLQHKKNKRKYFKSGKFWYKIPDFVTEYDWEIDSDSNRLKVDSLGLLRIQAALGELDQFVGSKSILNRLRQKIEFVDSAESPSLGETKLSLRSYQDHGLKWLWWLYNNNLHGLLADEMGLGKTHQAMALMSAILEAKGEAQFLVVCPTTVLDHWYDKVINFAPQLNPRIYHGAKRYNNFPKPNEKSVCLITSYGILLRDIQQLNNLNWDCIILDEAHLVKNNATASYKSACKLKSRMRVCLTGTPMENRLNELKSLFDFLLPGYLGSDEFFNKNFDKPINQETNREAEVALQRLIHPFKLRRTKEVVLPDLPAKIEDLRYCTLSAEQARLYKEVIELKAAPLINQLKDDGKPVPFLHVFATLTLLKQICNHPALAMGTKNFQDHESGKFELFKSLVEEALDSGHKIVIFSQYVEMIDIIDRYLTSLKVEHVVLTGQTRNRGEIIKHFQTTPECKVFCGSLLAGGIGIDLTAASVVIHFDRWWNASKENQATDRVHRIGQHNNVQVFKLITRGTLEEKIDQMIKAKSSLFEKFLDHDEEIFKNLTREELIKLLE